MRVALMVSAAWAADMWANVTARTINRLRINEVGMIRSSVNGRKQAQRAALAGSRFYGMATRKPTLVAIGPSVTAAVVCSCVLKVMSVGTLSLSSYSTDSASGAS
ncbi:hypothetical protein D3C75_1123000 [compost metagenome]